MPKRIEDESVYRAVMQVVIERGYAGATTKQMADAAGVSEVTLFRKYTSKPQLVREAINWLAEKIDFAAAVGYTGDLVADLTRIVQAYQDTAVEYGPFFVVIFSEMLRNAELASVIEEPVRIFTGMGELLARYQAAGVLRATPPLYTLAALLGPLMYSSLIRGAVSDAPLPPLDLSDHIAYFLAGYQC